MKEYSIDALLEGIGNMDPGVLEYIYAEYYRYVKRHVLNRSGTEQDARDIFQEAIIVLYRKQKNGSLKINVSFRNYLIGVSKMLWLHELRRRSKLSPEVEMPEEDMRFTELSGETSEEKSRYQLYQKHFLRLAEDCRNILQWFYGKTPLAEIARRMGYRSENYARKRKFLCKEKLMEMIRKDPSFPGK